MGVSLSGSPMVMFGLVMFMDTLLSKVTGHGFSPIRQREDCHGCVFSTPVHHEEV